MEGPTRTRVYQGTPEQQHEAYLADAVEAERHGWEPRSIEQMPGPIHVTFVRRERTAAIAPNEDVTRAALGPGAEAPADERLIVPQRRPRPWDPLVFGTLLAAMILAIWGVFVYKPVPPRVGAGSATAQPAVAHCAPASPSLIDTIGAGLTIPTGGGLMDGFTVTSRDHPGTLFVAALIEGIAANAPVGLWATNDAAGHGSIYSVNGKAVAFSDWPDGGVIPSHLSDLDDGADVAVACADG